MPKLGQSHGETNIKGKLRKADWFILSFQPFDWRDCHHMTSTVKSRPKLKSWFRS